MRRSLLDCYILSPERPDKTILDFTNWKCADGLVADIEPWKITIYKFPANAEFLTSKYDDMHDADFTNLFSYRYFNYSGIKRLYTEGIISEDGVFETNIPNHLAAIDYRWRGLSLCYLVNNFKEQNKQLNITLNYPWEMGIPGGKLKDPNHGWASAGYHNDGRVQLWNIEYNLGFDGMDGSTKNTCNAAFMIHTKDEDFGKIIDVSDHPIVIEYTGIYQN